MADDTIFDRILRQEIPANFVYEDEHVVAFKDINPQAPVHVLVIPRKKISDLRDAKTAPAADLAGFLSGVAKTASALGLDRDGYRTVINTGRDAQQSVAYLHAHILGGRSLGWTPG
jgi:histidine triad (HIT) family protein